MVGTPGPANILLMSAGTQLGFVRLIPFLIGLITGKLLLNISISFGLATALIFSPVFMHLLATVSAIYMISLAVRGWNPRLGNDSTERVFGYFAGLILHPISPKTWMMATLAFTQFSVNFDTNFDRYFLVPISFLIAQCVFHTLWCTAGVILKKKFSESVLLSRFFIILTISIVLWAWFYPVLQK